MVLSGHRQRLVENDDLTISGNFDGDYSLRLSLGTDATPAGVLEEDIFKTKQDLGCH